MKLLRPLAVAAGGTLAVHWSPATAAVLPGAARAFGIPTGLASDGVLLTFDDGPHPEGTPAVLTELDRVGASAVFFVSGEQVERYPELVSEIVAAGHELGLHGYRHRTRLQWSRRLLADDMRRARAAVSDAAGIEPRLYRPPHGVFSLAGLRLIRELGLEPLLWSKWGRDWERGATSETITAVSPWFSGRRRSPAARRGSLLRARELAGDGRRHRADRGPDRRRGPPDGLRMIERPKGGRAWKR